MWSPSCQAENRVASARCKEREETCGVGQPGGPRHASGPGGSWRVAVPLALSVVVLVCASAVAADTEDGPTGPGAVSSAGAVAEDATVRGSVVILRKRLFRGLKESDDRSGALVYVTGFESPPPAERATLIQRDERFEPRLLPVVAGQTVSFPNQDPIYHNVFSVSPVQPFDLGQYRSSDPAGSQSFESPGLVPVYCNIHPEMISYIAVLENTAFVVTGEDGTFEIPAIPAGRVTLNAWLPGAERVSRALDLAAGDVEIVDLELRATERASPHRRKDGSRYPEPEDAEYGTP